MLEERELPIGAPGRLLENYRFFEDRIARMALEPHQLYQGLNKLIIVDIALNRAHDNPQLIFESLNSTGLELSQADLIRNYILMRLELDEQTRLYNAYWYPMETNLDRNPTESYFDAFMRDYLTLKTGQIPNLRDVYEAFKTYARDFEAVHSAGADAVANAHFKAVEALVSDIHRYANYYSRMVLAQEPDAGMREAFNDIAMLRVDVAYPFLLEVYADYSVGTLERDVFLTMLRLIESYVFRRAVCGIPTNSLNKTFALLARELNKAQYLESFSAAMMLKDSYRRFPTDEEFTRELMIKDLYHFRTRSYWLRRLENHERKEPVNVDEYTIEHILPQNENLSAAWQKALGGRWQEIQAR